MVPLPAESMAELARLDEAIRPIAKGPVPLADLSDISELPQPMDQAGVRTEAQAFLLVILGALESGTEEDRRALRGLVTEYSNFFWATYPPEAATAVETLRLQLIHFALIDQYPDPRDAVLWLQRLCETQGVSLRMLASLRREVAPLASDKNRYGFGSTRSMLLRGYPSGYGKRGAPERKG